MGKINQVLILLLLLLRWLMHVLINVLVRLGAHTVAAGAGVSTRGEVAGMPRMVKGISTHTRTMNRKHMNWDVLEAWRVVLS